VVLSSPQAVGQLTWCLSTFSTCSLVIPSLVAGLELLPGQVFDRAATVQEAAWPR